MENLQEKTCRWKCFTNYPDYVEELTLFKNEIDIAKIFIKNRFFSGRINHNFVKIYLMDKRINLNELFEKYIPLIDCASELDKDVLMSLYGNLFSCAEYHNLSAYFYHSNQEEGRRISERSIEINNQRIIEFWDFEDEILDITRKPMHFC